MPTGIVLVRHGETEWSLAGKHTSRTDLGLLEEGKVRAKQVGAELAGRSFALVLCSPLKRARETCELAGFLERAEIIDDLREWSYGEYEGLTTPEIRQQRPEWNMWVDGCPGGESPAEVSVRADRVLGRVMLVDGDVIAFAHGHILRVLTARWMGSDVTLGRRLKLSAGSISSLGYERATQVLSRWNS